MIKNGKFFVLEGTNGCGKSTQQELITEALRKEGYNISMQNEPTHNSPIGQLLREHYYSGERWCDIALSNLLIAADRYEQTKRCTLPKLQGNINIIQSRNFMSSMSIAYADNRLGDNPKNPHDIANYIYEKNIDTIKILQPDAIFWIDTSVRRISKRINSLGEEHKDIYEDEKHLSYSREGYDYAANYLKSRGFKIYKINGDQTRKAITKDILDIIRPMLSEETKTKKKEGEIHW
jgi:dTMP kinase